MAVCKNLIFAHIPSAEVIDIAWDGKVVLKSLNTDHRGSRNNLRQALKFDMAVRDNGIFLLKPENDLALNWDLQGASVATVKNRVHDWYFHQTLKQIRGFIELPKSKHQKLLELKVWLLWLLHFVDGPHPGTNINVNLLVTMLSV